MNIPIDLVSDRLSKASRILIVSHVDPDGDAIGTQLAFGRYLRDMGKVVFMVRDSEIPAKYMFLPKVDTIVSAKSLTEDPAIDTALVLECPTLSRAGSATRFFKDNTTIVSIDHHKDSTDFGQVNWIDATASSVGEMAYEYFVHEGYDIPATIATQLYTAILTDTGRFRYSCTSPRTMTIAGDLIARGADPRTICDYVYYDLPPSTMLLTGKVLSSLEYYNDGTVCLLTLTNDMLAEASADPSESDGLVDFTLFTKGVTTGILLKEVDSSHTRVSLRSSDEIDVARIAASFGGGGHKNAAGCELPLPLGAAKQRIIEILQEAGDQSD